MKRIFTLAFALIAFAFCAKAQVTFIYESFDNGALPSGWTVLDADGDTYTWDAAFPYNGNFTTHSGDGCISSASYINDIGALSPDNWLIAPQLSVGTGCNFSFWVAGQDPSYAAEVFGVYVSTTGTNPSDFTSVYQGVATDTYTQVNIDLSSYAGQNVYVAIRHYNVTDMYWLNVDDVIAGTAPSTPVFNSYTESINFGQTLTGSEKIMPAIFTAFSLNDNVTVTTAAPFQVSADGVTFGTTATLTANTGAGNITNGNFFVKFAPTAEGAATGTITLASTGTTSVNINLAGTGFSCGIATIPYEFNFDNEDMALCWTTRNDNNDDGVFSIETDYGYAAYGYSENNAANDWLISPAFNLNGNQYAQFEYVCGLPSYPEKFEVYAIDNNGNASLLVPTVNVSNDTWAPMQVDLSNLNGTYSIGIKCVSDADMYILGIRAFKVDNGNVGVAEMSNETRIYPNPANSVLNINASSNINMVEVFNMMGQKVASYNANDTFATINTSNLNAGVYTVRISTENGVATQKFMVAR